MSQLKLRMLLGSTLIALGLSACAVAPQYTATEREMSETMGKDSFQPATRELRDGIETQELLAQAAFWMREYELNPADLEAAIKLSAAIRKVGNPQRAVEITQTTRALYPRDPYLAAEFAAALIASERAVEAMRPLDEALAYAPAYGRLWSLKGAALDQQEEYDLARQHYARALQITPNDPSVMSNIGLSYALSGDAETAEGWLRRAAASPGASQSVRQNLALVLQIQGKTEEAEKMTRLSQQQYSGRLPDLNPQAVQTIREPISNSQGRAPMNGMQQAYQQPQNFKSAPPVVTVNNSPSVSSGTAQPYSQARSASDAARMAAAQSGQRPQQDIMTPAQLKEQQDILALLANNVGARPANAAQQSPQQTTPYYPGRQPMAQGQVPQATQQAPQYSQAYPPQAPLRQGAKRERR